MYSKNCILILYQLICLPAHYLTCKMQLIQLNVNIQMGMLQCFSYKSMFPTYVYHLAKLQSTTVALYVVGHFH